jgi:hypothetical protein
LIVKHIYLDIARTVAGYSAGCYSGLATRLMGGSQAVIASAAKQSSVLIGDFWIALKHSDPLWTEAHVESYATSLRDSQ